MEYQKEGEVLQGLGSHCYFIAVFSRLSTDTDAAGNTGGVSGGGSSAAGIVITLVILLILVAVIAFIIYKPERR